MTRFIIHVGTAKTGSTTLQHAFTFHRKALLEYGILYPTIAHVPHHTHLLFAFCKDSELCGVYGRTSLEKIRQSQKNSENYWLNIYKQIEKFSPKIVVISSEYAWGLSDGTLTRLVEEVQDRGFSVELVGYLRSPPSFFASKLQQRLKYSSDVVVPHESYNYVHKYAKLRNLPVTSVNVQAFLPERFHFECIFRDFLIRYCGLPLTFSEKLHAESRNVSLSAEGIQLMQLYNHFTSPGPRVAGSEKNKALIETIIRCEINLNMSKPRLNENLRQYVININLSDLKILRDELGISFPDINYHYESQSIKVSPVLAREVFPCEDNRLSILIKSVADAVSNTRASALSFPSNLTAFFDYITSKRKYWGRPTSSALESSISEFLLNNPALEHINAVDLIRIIAANSTKFQTH